MSVAIATMGKFVPIFGSPSPPDPPIVVEGGGGSSYGWEKEKPVIVVDSVFDSDDDIRIKILKVIEWS